MPYTALNIQIFTAAYCGALAGMGLSDRQITDQSSVSYAGLASVAGAFAQAVDTAWGAVRATTLLDTEAIQSASQAFWQDRSPIPDSTNTLPATHASAALAIIATITAAETYYASQGLTPPAIPGGSSGGGFPNVADLATLGAINWVTNSLANGYQYYVHTQRSFWILSQTGTETINGNTVIAATGGGRWLRDSSFSHPSWLNVNDWYIDATNGNDEYNGQAAAPAAGNVGPLKTYGELARRWGGKNITPSAVSGSNFLCTVNFLTSLPTSDPVFSACGLSTAVLLRYQGKAETVLYSGTFTTVTARNPATNSATILGDTSMGSPTTYLNRRWRNTTIGARLNQAGWIAKDLGGTNFRSSTPQIINAATVTDPQVGDTFNIETLTTISLGDVSPFMIQAGDTGNTASIQFRELAIRANGFASCNFNAQGFTTIQCFTCDFQTTATYGGSFLNRMFNCQFQIGAFIIGGLVEINAGLVCNALTGANGLVNASGGVWTLTNAAMCQGVNIKGGGINIVDACVFDCPNNGFNSGGHGILLGKCQSNATQQPHSLTGWLSMDTRLWGNGNAGVGVYIGAGCQFNYAAGTVAGITITGTGGDFKVNGNSTANVWDQTASAGAGAWLAPRNCTWANLAAAVGAAGFGGNAVDITSGARVSSAAAA